MGGWGPPLRIARRTTRKSLGRTFLVACLIGLPVLAATWMGVVFKTSSPEGENLARIEIGQADARLDVTQYGKLAALPGEPSLMSSEPAPAEGAEQPVRVPATFDPTPLLPGGSTVARAFVDAGMVEIRGPQANTSVSLVVGDGTSQLTQGTVKLDQGRLPATKSEIAVSPSLAKQLGLGAPTGTVTSATGKSYAVVGIARTMSTPSAETIFAAPDTALRAADPGTSVRYLVKLPASADAKTLAKQLPDQGLFLLPRANIVDPPPDPYGGTSGDLGPYAAMALVIGFGILEIILLAGTAFAVGARRQTRELGLVMAAGGTPRDVRRIVLLQGLFAGLVGVIGGLAVATALVLAGKPVWEEMTSAIFTGWQIPWTSVVLIALLGLLAGLAAAVVPAIAAARQTPMAALAGRFATTTGSARVRVPAVVLLVGGMVCVFIGSGLIAAALKEAQRSRPEATVTPTGPIALVLLGITATIAALVWMLPSLVAKFAGFARVLPLSARLAVRDAARHRHRTGPATAAIMMAVAGTAAVAFAASNGIAAEAKGYTPIAKHGDAVVHFENVPYSQSTEQKVAALLPVRHTYRLATVSLPDAKTNEWGYLPTLYAMSPVDSQGTSYSLGLLAVDPAFIARFDEYGAKAADELRAGKVVLPNWNGQKVDLYTDGEAGESSPARTLDAAATGAPPNISFLRDNALISNETAAKVGTVTTFEVQYELTREPTEDELAAVARLLGNDDVLKVERGFQSPARMFMIGILVAATVVTLLGVAISVSLSAAEGRADLATLAAIGAQPRRRRNLAAAQAWVLGQFGCLLGVGVGALYGYTAHAAFGSPRFMVPWTELGGIVIVVPLFAGTLAWLMTRSRLPMVSRID
ncbi:putative ABC transport system permease protein [Kribbella antiqua]|uniref:Putative ABC transport system permease protein n=1 Tax=Kribbella antiqua TaxID=2512217 RepID=A0A4R2IPQ6_9ACTN|nr:FtsX-like permease family protein [Kribbella antiqua]TCO45998.1 putative ABC transport system permease protein [Kribbella antiqua]